MTNHGIMHLQPRHGLHGREWVQLTQAHVAIPVPAALDTMPAVGPRIVDGFDTTALILSESTVVNRATKT